MLDGTRSGGISTPTPEEMERREKQRNDKVNELKKKIDEARKKQSDAAQEEKKAASEMEQVEGGGGLLGF